MATAAQRTATDAAFPPTGGFFFVYFAQRHMSAAFARPSDPKVAVLRPYTTFEGQVRYRKVLEHRPVKRTMKVIVTK